MGHDADVESEQAVEQLFHDLGGGLEEGGLGFGEGAHGREEAVGPDEEGGERGDLLGWRRGGDVGRGSGQALPGIGAAGGQCCHVQIVASHRRR